MGDNAGISMAGVPDHVPADLVRPWTYDEAPGAQQDIHLANTALLQGPEIFYSTTTVAATAFSAWMVTRSDLMREILRDPETFSSRHLTGWAELLGETWELIPLETDGRTHRAYRMLMNPLFSPKNITALEDRIRQSAGGFIDAALKNGGCDFQLDFGHPFPVSVFLHLMGLPVEQMEQFLAWETGLLHGETTEDRRAAAQAIKDYLVAMIAERRQKPTGDLISFAVTSRIDDRFLTEDEMLGMVFVLFAAGLDTVASMLGFIFKYLAENPEQQRLLRREPELIGNAMEEMIRALAPVTTTRVVTRDIDFHGVRLKKDDRINLPLPVAARDERECERPNEIDFRRERFRHITFGDGPHVCIGAHLARREIKIALEEWLTRVPEFRIADGQQPKVHAHGVWGLSSLPLTW